MSAGMAGVIAAHGGHSVKLSPQGAFTVQCQGCGRSTPAGEGKVPRSGAPIHAAHVAEELAKAGYGNVPAALLAAADEMPIETLGGADKASVWLRHRAHSQDPEGHTLVKAIHDRKAEA